MFLNIIASGLNSSCSVGEKEIQSSELLIVYYHNLRWTIPLKRFLTDFTWCQCVDKGCCRRLESVWIRQSDKREQNYSRRAHNDSSITDWKLDKNWAAVVHWYETNEVWVVWKLRVSRAAHNMSEHIHSGQIKSQRDTTAMKPAEH